MKKRTNADFSKHELFVIDRGNQDIPLSIYFLKLPDTITHCVKFICIDGITAVTGDYGNWIFNNEFHPSNEGVSDGYWLEKLRAKSSQEPHEFSSDVLKKQIEQLEDLTEEEKEWYKELIHTSSHEEYIYKVMSSKPPSIDYMDIPSGKEVNYWLQVVFDAFEEICKRKTS